MQNGTRVIVQLGLLLATVLAGGCKSEEEKRAQALAEAQKKAAETAIAAAEAQAKVAEQQLEKSAEALAKQGEAIGQQGAALGMQAAAAGLQAAAAAMTDVAGAAAGGKAAELVDFRALKALLPEKVGDLARKSTSGEKNAAMGFGASEAKGVYEGAGGARVKIQLIDHGGLAGMAAAAFALESFEVDKESDDGYERTIKVDGRKIYEKYSNQSKRGELKAMVGKRFLVEVEGDEVPMTTIKEALAKLDLAKLEALAPPAAK